MSEKYLIGVDIGTQGTKTALYTTDGKKLGDALEASRLITPFTGAVQQEPDEMYGSVLRTIAEVINRSGINPSQVAGIGVDGQMAGILGIDRDWNAVTWYDSWLDTRCEKQIGQIRQTAENRVVRITGCPVTYAHGPKVLWWKQEHPQAYAEIDKFVLPGTYVIGRLCGLKSDAAWIDYSHLHFSGFGDVERKVWSDELLELFDVDKSKMPDIVDPWKIVGYLTKESAEQCGLVPGIPLVAGCGDSAATSLAAGVTEKGIIFDVAGTASIFSCCVDTFQPDMGNKTLLYARSVIPGLWTPMAYINGGGMCLQWFRDRMTGVGRTGAYGTATPADGPEIKMSYRPVSYRELDAEAENIEPGSGGLIFLPHFSGRVCPNNPYVRGSWLGLTWTHDRAHLYRSIMEGIAYEYDYYYHIIRSLVKDAEFREVYAIGGGARSRLFNSIKADVLGLGYATLETGDTAPLGSALLAGYGTGVFRDLKKTVDGMIRINGRINCDETRHKAYEKYSGAYSKVFDALEPTFREISG